MPLADLIDATYLGSVWDTSQLSAAQAASLATLIRSATRAVRAHCNRIFTRTELDELYTVEDWQSPLVLRQFPVNGILAVMTDPSDVLQVSNSDVATNQRATVALATTGSVADFTIAATGVLLTRWASGVKAQLSVPFSLNPTVAAVAAAINAAGGGWRATADPAHALRASADFRPPQGAYGCLGAAGPAGLAVHTSDVAFDLDAEAGLLSLDPSRDSDPFESPRWGVFLGTDWGDARIRGADNGVRVVYDAGFDAVPPDVMYWTAMAVKSFAEQAVTDSTLASERARDRGYQARDSIPALPQAVRDGLEPWRNPRA